MLGPLYCCGLCGRVVPLCLYTMLRVTPKISNTKISNTKPDSEHFEVLTLKLKDGRDREAVAFAVFAVAFAVFAVATTAFAVFAVALYERSSTITRSSLTNESPWFRNEECGGEAAAFCDTYTQSKTAVAIVDSSNRARRYRIRNVARPRNRVIYHHRLWSNYSYILRES